MYKQLETCAMFLEAHISCTISSFG